MSFMDKVTCIFFREEEADYPEEPVMQSVPVTAGRERETRDYRETREKQPNAA